MSTRPTAFVLGADDESTLQQTLGDTGGMAGSMSLGLFGPLAGEQQKTQEKIATSPVKLRSTPTVTTQTERTRSTRSAVL